MEFSKVLIEPFPVDAERRGGRTGASPDADTLADGTATAIDPAAAADGALGGCNPDNKPPGAASAFSFLYAFVRAR